MTQDDEFILKDVKEEVLQPTHFEMGDFDFIREELPKLQKFSFPKLESRNLIDLVKDKEVIKKYLEERKCDIFKI